MNTKRIILLVSTVTAAFFAAPVTATAETARELLQQARAAYSGGDLKKADALLDQIVAADPSFVPARALQAQVKQRLATTGGGDAMKRKCASVSIAKVDFADVELKLALDALAAMTADATGGEFRPNFVLGGGDEVGRRKVSLQLRAAPLTVIIEYLGTMSKVDFRYEQFAVVGNPQLTAGSGAASTEESTPTADRKPEEKPWNPFGTR